MVRSLPLSWLRAACVAAAVSLCVPQARAAAGASDLSMAPLAVSVMAPAGFLQASAKMVVVSVEASAEGTVWVIERVGDGVRMTVNVSGRAVKGAASAVGTVVVATAISTGTILSAAGEVIAFVPSELGKALFYDEQVTQ